jgi:hypothetical protein
VKRLENFIRPEFPINTVASLLCVLSMQLKPLQMMVKVRMTLRGITDGAAARSVRYALTGMGDKYGRHLQYVWEAKIRFGVRERMIF